MTDSAVPPDQPLPAFREGESAPARAGFAGLGLMGLPMATNLLRAGWEVTAWNRSEPALADFAARGGRRAGSVAELRGEPVIVFMLPDLGYIESAAAALLAAWEAEPPEPGTAVVVMSSVSPVAVQAFGQRVSRASHGHATLIDAPVSGGTLGARDGSLAIMVGAEQGDFERLAPLFTAMGGTVRRLGGLGAGSLAKACNQLVVGTTTAALAEAAELAERCGIEAGALFDVLAGGLAGSKVLDVVGPRIAAQDYTPTGPAKFMHKDLLFVREAARQTGAAVPLTDAALQIYATLNDQGLGELDLAAVRRTMAILGEAGGGSRQRQQAQAATGLESIE
jgi:2-hydroxy-3-oxopropionate reductase